MSTVIYNNNTILLYVVMAKTSFHSSIEAKRKNMF